MIVAVSRTEAVDTRLDPSDIQGVMTINAFAMGQLEALRTSCAASRSEIFDAIRDASVIHYDRMMDRVDAGETMGDVLSGIDLAITACFDRAPVPLMAELNELSNRGELPCGW